MSSNIERMRYALAKQVRSMRDSYSITVSTDYGDLILDGEHAQRVVDRIESELQRALTRAERQKAVLDRAAERAQA